MTTTPAPALADLIPPTASRVLIRRSETFRHHNDYEVADDLAAAPPAWFSGPLADPSAADAASAVEAAEARLTAARAARAALPPEVRAARLRVTRRGNGDHSPSLAATAHEDDRIYGEVIAPAEREEVAAERALSASRRALCSSLFVVSDDLAAARVAAYAAAREVSAVQARESLSTLTEALSVAHLAGCVAADEAGTARPAVVAAGLPANSRTLADLAAEVEAL